MQIEKQAIYKKYNKNGGQSYLLVLDVQKHGMSFVYLTNKRDNVYYSNIDGLYIGDLDRCIAINRILYTDWSRVIAKYYEKYRNLSIREMRKITNAVKDLYDGIIVYDANDRMCYSDELTEPIKEIANKEESAIDPQSSESVQLQTHEDPPSQPIEKPVVDAQLHDAEVEVSVENNIIAAKVETESDSNIASDSNEEYIDLLKDNPTTDEEFLKRKRDGGSGVKRHHNNRVHRRFFSETEALHICHMRNLAIMQKYDVPSSIATLMRKNALEYFGESSSENNRSPKNNYSKLFNEGYTVDQVIAMYPDKASKIRHCWKSWYTLRNRVDNPNYMEVLNSFINDDDDDSMNELIKISNMTNIRIVEYFGCSSPSAQIIAGKVQRALSKKSILFTVFGIRVFDTDEFNKFIEKSQKRYACANIVTMENYNTCMRLKDIYDATYDIHQDIIIGAKPIPDSISPNDVPKFISIIKRSFTTRIDNDHIPNIQAICANKDAMEYATLMMMDYNNATRSINRMA